ncbi:hypothetical protein ACWGB8_38030 [Kitasatospora sp. NPDC054939]
MQLLHQLAVALHHEVGAVEDVVEGLACTARVVVPGGAVELEQWQPVGPQQLLAQGEELGRQRIVGQPSRGAVSSRGDLGRLEVGFQLLDLLGLPVPLGLLRARLGAALLRPSRALARRELGAAHRAGRPAEQHRLGHRLITPGEKLVPGC